MVSRFSYPSFKQFNVDKRIKFAYTLIVPLFIALVAIRPADDAALHVCHVCLVRPCPLARSPRATRQP